MRLLCRNRVIDFDRWWSVFTTHPSEHEAAGLRLEAVWLNSDDPVEVFFIFEVTDRVSAEAFMATPEANEAGEKAGVIEGEVWFLEDLESPE